MTLTYNPPVLENFAEDYDPKQDIIPPQTTQGLWKAKHNGKFVFFGLRNSVTLLALANAIQHKSVLERISYETTEAGIVLGGGNIIVNPEGVPERVSGSSYSFGGLPKELLRAYFESNGLEVEVVPSRGDIFQDTKEWLKERGFDL
jgi:hypothetical protein